MPEKISPQTTSKESSLQEIRPPKPAREMIRVADDIKLAFSGNPDFDKSFKSRKNQAKIVLEGWMHGEISQDQATDIIAAQQSELEMALETDQLMDIPNRLAIARMIAEQIALARRSGKPVSIAFVDLDDFGKINKVYGEEAGDATLQAVGTYLKSEQRRPGDKVGRRSGEEIIILLPDTDEAGAMQVLERIRESMPESVADIIKNIGGFEFDRSITMSTGLVTTTIDRQDLRNDSDIMLELLSIADERMRLAKNNGRNRTVDSRVAQQLSQQTAKRMDNNG